MSSNVIPISLQNLKLNEPIGKIPLDILYAILAAKRVASGNSERAIIDRFIAPICVRDGYGNYHKHIIKANGEESKVMWSCHTDTVHSTDGRQKLHLTASGIIKLADVEKKKECLGADDGAGLFLMLEMIRYNVPGYYIFHRDEESGRGGSRYVAKEFAKDLADYDYSIAFDRREKTSIITHQSARRSASDKFAESIKPLFPSIAYTIDKGGSYTDTFSYVDIIKECTNLSVGYSNAHNGNEELDLKHLLLMRDALITFDESKLVAERDPSKSEYDRYDNGNNGGYYRNWNDDTDDYGDGWYGGYNSKLYQRENAVRVHINGKEKGFLSDRARMVAMIRNYPWLTAQLLQTYGLTPDTLKEEFFGEKTENTVVHIGGKAKSAAELLAEQVNAVNAGTAVNISDKDRTLPEIISNKAMAL